jgi:hypothetical protein
MFMDSYILNQLEFVRNNTLNAVEGITEEMANYIPMTLETISVGI